MVFGGPFFKARPQAWTATRSGKKNSFNHNWNSQEKETRRKRKGREGGGEERGSKKRGCRSISSSRWWNAHTRTRRFFPSPFIEAREASFSGVDSRIMFAERALSKRTPRLGWTVCWRSARCLFYLAAICIQGGGGEGEGVTSRSNAWNNFSLSLSFLPGGHFQTLLPPSDQISPPVVAVILAAIRPVSWFMARDVSNSFFFSSFLLLSSSKKNFYSFVRLFMDGSISTRSKKYEESRINTNAGGGGGDLVEIHGIFLSIEEMD